MGKGNVCTYRPYEGLYYIDNDDFHVYRRNDSLSDYPDVRLLKDMDIEDLQSDEWYFDDVATGDEFDDIIGNFVDDFTAMFPSFEDKWTWTRSWYRDQLYDVTLVAESRLFYIAIKDNEWSVAIMLIQKESPCGSNYDGLQAKHFQRYLDGMKKCLFNRLDELGIYAGAWTSGTIRKEESA